MRLRIHFIWIAFSATALSFLLRLAALHQTPFANGWDSYFYAVQLQSLAEEGKMHSEEWTLLYPVLYLFSLAFGYVASIKIVSSLFAGLFTLAIALISYDYTKSVSKSLLITSLTLISPELTYFSAQWPKNLLGIDLLLFLLLFLQRKNLRWAILFLILGFFGHRLTAVLGLLLFGSWFSFDRVNKRLIGFGVLGVILLLTVIQFFPGLLSIYDFGRLKGLIGQTLIVAPLEFAGLFGAEKISFVWNIEIWICYLAFILFFANTVYSILKKAPDKIAIGLLLLLLVLLLPIYKLALEGAAYRFFHTGMLLSILCIAFLVKEVNESHALSRFFMIASLCLVAGSFLTYKSYSPAKHDPPYAMYEQVAVKLSETWREDNKPELIIAHKSLAEYITFSTHVDAMPWLPEYVVDDDKLYRVGFFPLKQLALFYLNEDLEFLVGNYGYVKQSDWNKFIDQLKANESADVVEMHLDWKNPSSMRPAFLLKN